MRPADFLEVNAALTDPTGLPEGLIEYEARMSIRDLIRLHGYETARDLVAGYLNDEAERKPRHG